MSLQLPRGRGENRIRGLVQFGRTLIEIANKIGFKLSSRGWAYQLEGFGLINKREFNKVQNYINECRKMGILPIDFVAEEESRKFSGVEFPETRSPEDFLSGYIKAIMDCEEYYTPNWWDGENYYIQMLVEKIDLKTLFSPICRKYHIPIATSKGWSSMLQRAEYSRRFQKAKEKGLKCVLLYCGDHDPDGLRISEFIRSNLYDLMNVRWNDGTKGYDPRDLIIDRFGLNYDFIEENNLSWIDNLITGSGKNLASPSHPNYEMEYVQDYLSDIGERKCEANAIVVKPDQARDLVREAIEKYLREDALNRFEEKRERVREMFEELRDETGVQDALQTALETLEGVD